MAKLVRVDDPQPQLLEKVYEDLPDLMSEWIGHMARQMPLESELGLEHTIEALLTAVETIGGSEAQDVVSAFGHKRSGDPTAKGAVHVTSHESDDMAALAVDIALPFMQTMDQGGMLSPISPGGKKEGGISTTGVLYSPRSPIGTGMLLWFDPSHPRAGPTGYVYARNRYLSPLNFVSNAADEITQSALSKGYIRNG